MKFNGEIKVASRIIDYLSSGLYHTPAACLKELINNAYDADAKIVNVFVKPDAGRIIITDDGSGMSRAEFEKHFARVSESHKRDTGEKTKSGRSKIGKIGIGFIAANELCETMEIFSTKEDSADLLHVIIDFKEMRKPIEERSKENSDVKKADYEGEILTAEPEEHYTQIILTDVRGEASNILSGAKKSEGDGKLISLYGKKHTTIGDLLRTTTLKSWDVFDFYSKTMLEISLNVPVKYHDNWLPKITSFDAYIPQSVDETDFTVYYDGTELRKPTVFSSKDSIIEEFHYEGVGISAKGYFYAQHGSIRPQEIQGLMVRIRNAAVGEYDGSFWGYPNTDQPLIQKWVSMEVYADDRLEEAMNIDRRTLRVTHPAYVELQAAIHQHLRRMLIRTRKEIYQVASNKRRTVKVSEYREKATYTASSIFKFSPAIAHDIERSVSKDRISKHKKTIYEEQYYLTDVYDALIKSCDGLLDENTMTKLLEKFNDEIGKL
jgi:hypothetical protein